jgi:polysaccharide deacetylase family protein (PEP-CTERM system associated)
MWRDFCNGTEKKQQIYGQGTFMHALTIDVEDWPQSTLDFSLPITERAVHNTRSLLSILRRYEVRATFFVLGLLAERFPQLVAEIAADGHEIGSHGFSHKPVFAIGPVAFADELARSVGLLEEICGQRVMGYRAPDFSITQESLWALDIIADQGLRYDSSIFPVRTSRYGIPGMTRHAHRLPNGLIELPLSTVRWGRRNWPVAGGGYMRLCPYWLTCWAVKRIQGEGTPAVVYVHPYELDPTELDEIEWPVPTRMRLTQSLNRRFMQARLERLLNDFEFGPVTEVLKLTPTLVTTTRASNMTCGPLTLCSAQGRNRRGK